MKPRTLRNIIFLMSISLIGIIIMQVFWISNAYKVTGEQFSANVTEALNTLTSRIEAREAMLMISGDTTNTLPEVPNIDITGENEPTKKKPLEKERVIIQIESNTSDQDTPTHPAKNALPDHGKPLVIKATTKSIKPVIIPYDTGEGLSITIIDSIRIENKMEHLRDVMLKIVREGQTRQIPLAKRLESINFSTLLKSALEQHAIQLEYEYGITSGADTILQTTGYNHRANKELYSINLYPNDLVERRDYLHIYFPGRFGFLFMSLITTITVSFLFTLIIVLTFLFTITSIVRQKRVSEIKNDFISNMTHEFKTPIATVMLASDSIGTPALQHNPSMIQELNKVIREEAKRMNQNVEKVLQFSMLDRGNIQVNAQRFSVHETIEKATNRIRLQLEQRGGTLEKHLEAEQSIIEADRDHMLNILLNILDNAIKYSPDVPEIAIRSYNKESWVKIAITDRGIGISPEEQKRIFDRFYRVHTGNIHNIKGFGLGLSYVHELITAFGGHMTVDSNKGEGSTFTISIPYVKRP